jgi:prepilin-type N-terminal cleavage/methylation domain-containing protein
MNTRSNTKGFTIIEVVLVLAIAALIFLMIFIALPALQRGQRDTARKQDVGTVAAAVNSYRSNHRGSLPDSASDLSDYIDNLSQIDASDGLTVGEGEANAPDELDKIVIQTKAKCDSDNNATSTDSTRQAAVLVKLENGGAYCQDV